MNTWNGAHYNSHRNVLIIPSRKNFLQKIFCAINFRSLMRLWKILTKALLLLAVGLWKAVGWVVLGVVLVAEAEPGYEATSYLSCSSPGSAERSTNRRTHHIHTHS